MSSKQRVRAFLCAQLSLVPAVVASAQDKDEVLQMDVLETPAPSAEVDGQAADIDPLDIPPENDPLANAWSYPNQRNGFYGRVTMALGFHNTRLGPAPWKDDGVEAHGFGTGFGLDAGYMLAPWVALHLDTTLGVLWNGDVVYDGGYTVSPNDTARVLAYGFAPAATFFAPHDFFFKPAFGVGLATVRQRSDSDTSHPGFYMDLMVGKDIVISSNVAIGLSFQLIYLLLGNDASHEELRVRQYLFGLSAAFDSI